MIFDEDFSRRQQFLDEKYYLSTRPALIFDGETGLHYNRYYYSPYVGRFISKDPIGLFGGYNNYAYAPNSVG
ncbi:RHS repeat-associated core domain-containing protein [Acinetobacter pittii]|uniref:RHS repeat-associated core domain-containing protein n=1 Tax=Acinetobacter pittii TaxID=48296 RepID=UPI002E75C9A8|nr:RHS repeat-associated core domain-containing protein [Acinetobacter pittii]WVH57731.1 RHS repeat-associated core domain-containing protein [Acinetobacter pittii]